MLQLEIVVSTSGVFEDFPTATLVVGTLALAVNETIFRCPTSAVHQLARRAASKGAEAVERATIEQVKKGHSENNDHCRVAKKNLLTMARELEVARCNG
ncbi:hypothetical protein Tco_0481828 [Tanacetum coccineum]